jgi:hypothetical protein
MVPFFTDDGPTLETHNRQLLEAARTDNVELLTEIFAKHGEYDIRYQLPGWVGLILGIEYMFLCG